MFRMAALSWRALLLPGLLLAAAGCSSGVTPTPGGPCATNHECPIDQICISGKCQGGAKKACKLDTECLQNEYCDIADGKCKMRDTVLCRDDSVCPASQRCNISTGVCIDGARACTDDTPCTPISKHCNTTLNQCVECLDMSHCTGGKTCTNNVCVDPQVACTGDFTCMPPQTICEQNVCVPGCTATSCGNGLVCNSTSGRCVSGPTACAGDPECGPPRSICENTQCIPGCTEPGGLQCTGGNVCDATTGRCMPASNNCTTDPSCGPPARVCEASQCVPGCGQPGGLSCGAGTVCDTNTGRCVTVMGPCQTDAACGPPAHVCETGQCIPGCGEIGGLQCSGNTVCNATTGRCDPGTAVCTADAACGAPANICNLQNGQCVPGCAQTGCTMPQTCNTATGHCETPMTGAPLDAVCAANGDCGSTVCADLGGSVGKRCVKSCGSSGDCGAGFTCYDFNGAKMCLGPSVFSGANFSTPVGGACANGGQCHSNFCDGSRCSETCSDPADCAAAGGMCTWFEYASDSFAEVCHAPIGAGATGASCGAPGDCQSGICVDSICATPCSTTAQCGNGSTCTYLDASVCILRSPILGICLRYDAYIVRACVPQTHGQTPVGGACTSAAVCRSGLCHTGISQCVDSCGVDADCPGTHRCKVDQFGQLSDGTNLMINVCLPAGM